MTPEGNSNIGIGALPDATRPLSGMLDDVRVYNRVLSAAEISGLYNGGAGCQ
jgi:hypothetical protein